MLSNMMNVFVYSINSISKFKQYLRQNNNGDNKYCFRLTVDQVRLPVNNTSFNIIDYVVLYSFGLPKLLNSHYLFIVFIDICLSLVDSLE